MDNIITDLSLNFTGADGTIHIFRIAGLRNPVTADKADAALDDIAGIGMFVNL